MAYSSSFLGLPHGFGVLCIASGVAAQSPIAASSPQPPLPVARTAALVATSSALLPPPANDDCAAPIAISGPGPHAFDTSSATSGAQQPVSCGAAVPTIRNDVWFCWTATTSGVFALSTGGYIGMDSKVALYAGCGCPAGAELACSDDGCNSLRARLEFLASAGASYTIQIGTPPTLPSGTPGVFTILPVTRPYSPCALDDGVTENSLGLNAGGHTVWLQRFGAPGVATTVSSVSLAWGSTWIPHNEDGLKSDVLVWDDLDDDGDPRTHLALVAQEETQVFTSGTDTLETIALAAPVNVQGYYFVGAGMRHGVGRYPAAFDQGPPSCGLPMEAAWICGSTTSTVDYTDLKTGNIALVNPVAIGFAGVFLLRTDCDTPGTAYCAGDALDPLVTTPCPCNNAGALHRGCASSFSAQGAQLTAHGIVSSLTATLDARGMNATGSCLFVKGNANDPGGLVFHDGLRCATGTLVRMRSKPLNAGTASFPGPGDPPLDVAGGTPLGSGLAAYYLVFYRNSSAGFCPPATANATNGFTIAW